MADPSEDTEKIYTISPIVLTIHTLGYKEREGENTLTIQLCGLTHEGS